jgi:hypothetical protein
MRKLCEHKREWWALVTETYVDGSTSSHVICQNCNKIILAAEQFDEVKELLTGIKEPQS